MFARITPFKMKPGSRKEAEAIMARVKDQIMGLQGMQHFLCTMNDDGSGYIVSLVSSKDDLEANKPRVKEIWGNFADLLEAQPKPEGFEVVEEWVKETA
ncbi:antibiotic biosynthesis monooxygenase family protein [Salipiger mucosus]|uniref:ABM domain-containing protein n=1 Tax=Salipiger mucosus DSM 16094 TaxID=1123237 RepID=S9RKK3_9RHOB|nr:hypothetical protein [Salipiger mucosus]EPX78640.1 hypothetical protein Salmuc_04221 [Salipiger mucosus DSM 16094]